MINMDYLKKEEKDGVNDIKWVLWFLWGVKI